MICTNRIKLLKIYIYNNINYIFGTKKMKIKNHIIQNIICNDYVINKYNNLLIIIL